MILIIDNYDSFTFNLARYFEELDQDVRVIKNDELSIESLQALAFSHLVLSPGPCTPNESGICLQAIECFAGKIPILGVCLGHQAIAQVFGGSVVKAKHILHGKTATINIVAKDSILFASCPSSFTVTRYHSLLVDEASLPTNFTITAVCSTQGTQEIMAIEDASRRIYGLQFHPESLLTEYGHEVLYNFVNEG